MDFTIEKNDFDSAVRQILQGRKDTSADVVELTADRSTLAVVVTGRSIEVPIEAASIGSASIPTSVMFGLERIRASFQDERFRLRISDGKLGFQSTSISHPAIAMKKVARRIIDIPDDACPLDILSLRLIFSVDEIEDCGLHGKVLEAETNLTNALDSACLTLRNYSFDREELRGMAQVRVKKNAEGLRRVLFAAE